MQKMKQNKASGRFADFFAKWTACVLSAGMLTTAHLGLSAIIGLGGLSLSTPTYAQSTCTGGYWNCITFIKGSWQNQSSPDVQTTIRISDFTFPAVTTAYPVTSTNQVRRSTQEVSLSRPMGANPGSNIAINARPNSNLIWDDANNGFRVRDVNNLVLRFDIGTTRGNCNSSVGRNGTTIYGDVPSPSTGRTSVLQYGLLVCVRAVITGNPQGPITLPTLPIFDLTFGGVAVGKISVAGGSVINPPPPPAPRTCDPYNGGDKTFNLGRIEVNRLNNNATQGGVTETVNLTNCPANISLRLNLRDANDQNATRNYLRSTGTAANAGVQMFYNNALITMGNSWNVVTTAGGNSFPFLAKFYHITSQGNLGVGSVTSAATLTIQYP